MYNPQQGAPMQGGQGYAQAMAASAAAKQAQQHAMMQQQVAMQQQQQAALHQQQQAQRKRKHTAPQQGGHYSQQQQQQYAQQQQYQQQQQHHPRSAGMGLGLAVDDEPTDFLFDDMDRVSSRDVALARYRRNHDLLGSIFDARRPDLLEPPASVYAHLSASDLRAKLAACEAEIPALEAAHAQRMADVRAALDARALTAQAEEMERKRAAYRARSRAAEGGDSEMDPAEEEDEGEEWAKDASLGPIVGIASLSERERTPDDVRAQIPLPAKAPELAPAPPSRITPPPVAPALATAAAASSAPLAPASEAGLAASAEAKPASGDAEADEDADAEADADGDGDADGDADGEAPPSASASAAAAAGGGAESQLSEAPSSSLPPLTASHLDTDLDASTAPPSSAVAPEDSLALLAGSSSGAGAGGAHGGVAAGAGEELNLDALLAGAGELDLSLLAAEGLAGPEASAVAPPPGGAEAQEKPADETSKDQPAGEAEAPLVPLVQDTAAQSAQGDKPAA